MVSLPLRELNVRIRNLARVAFLFFQIVYFFRLFFSSFIFNFFFINISFSELPVITVSLFIRIDDLVLVMFVYSARRFPVSGLDERYHLHVEMQTFVDITCSLRKHRKKMLKSVCVKGFKPIQLVQKLE